MCAVAAKHSNIKMSNREIQGRYNRNQQLCILIGEKMEIDRRVQRNRSGLRSSSFNSSHDESSSFITTSMTSSEYISSHMENHYANVSDVILERSNDDDEGDSSYSRSLIHRKQRTY